MTTNHAANGAISAALSAVVCFAVSYTLHRAGIDTWPALAVGFIVGIAASSLLAWWRFGRSPR